MVTLPTLHDKDSKLLSPNYSVKENKSYQCYFATMLDFLYD